MGLLLHDSLYTDFSGVSDIEGAEKVLKTYQVCGQIWQHGQCLHSQIVKEEYSLVDKA